MKVPRSIKRLFPDVEKVIFSKKSVRVQVTTKDCTDGKALEASECAMARAMRRQYHASGAVIRLSRSYIIKGKTAVCFSTPVSVAREIVSFDRHRDFAPGDYKLAPAKLAWGKPREQPTSGQRGGKDHKIILHRTVRVRSAN